MTEHIISSDELRDLGAKLDGLELTENQRTFLMGGIALLAREDNEVAGFDVSSSASNVNLPCAGGGSVRGTYSASGTSTGSGSAVESFTVTFVDCMGGKFTAPLDGLMTFRYST